VTACSGALVTFEKVRIGAQRIVVGTIIEGGLVDGVAERITLRVDSVIRGVSGPEVVLEPPTFMGCDGRITEAVGSRLIVATGPHYFSASPPQEMHPYWRLLEGDVVEAVGVDDPDPDHTRLVGLVADLGGLPAAPSEPDAVVDPASAPDRGGIVAAAIVVATLLTATVLFAAVILVERKRRPSR